MAIALITGQDNEAALEYLLQARKHLTQSQVAKRLDVDIRTVRRWEARQSPIKSYLVPALQRLLPFGNTTSKGDGFTFIDLFAGIGGIRTAFESIGGHCVFTSERDTYAQKTYAINFPDDHEIAGDITQVNAQDIPDHDVLLAGFPCQPFSIAGVSKKNALGRAHGFACETQGTLFFDVARIIEAKRPRAFLLENVKNLVSHDKGRTFDVIRRTLTEELGYHIHFRVIDGAHFVPQHRERILIVGFREPVAFDFDAIPLPPKNEHTLSEVLHRTDGTEPELLWDEGKYFDYSKQKVHAKYTLTDKLWQYLQSYAKKHRQKGNGFGFGLVGSDDVARTLSARYYKDGSEILVYQGRRRNPRRLTPRECARLMGFPDKFRIPLSDTRAYLLLSQSSVVPMVETAAKLMIPQLLFTRTQEKLSSAHTPEDIMSSGRWTKEQLKLAFHLYCQLPFGKLHKGNKEIIALAGLIGRTPSAVAMKLVNFASLDPEIVNSGRTGLGNASALDKTIWDEFHANWEGLAMECAQLKQQLESQRGIDAIKLLDADDEAELNDFSGETRKVFAEQRIKQHFFRRAVLSSYRGRCCMSGITESRLLIASHIVPWCVDKANRLNPSNGLCLSAIHDKAFDKGLIALSNDFTVIVSDRLRNQRNDLIRDTFLSIEGKQIELPERFMPSTDFLTRHRSEIFQGV